MIGTVIAMTGFVWYSHVRLNMQTIKGTDSATLDLHKAEELQCLKPIRWFT